MIQAIKKRDDALNTGLKISPPVIVSFIIPALNEERWIAKCLDSIHGLTLPATVASLEIIVVDNQSVDRTVEICRRHGATIVSCPPGNAARARNAGAAVATGDWLAFVDADCCLDSDWLVHGAETITDTDIVATGSQIVPPNDTSSWVTQTLGELSAADTAAGPQSVCWLPTAGLLVKQTHFQAIAGFNENLVTCEDCDLGYRLSERGQLLFNPAATLVHYGESKSLREVLWREAWRTQGNVRLAFSRPGDLKNWISLLVPAVFILCIATGFVGVTLSLFTRMTVLAWGIMLLPGGLIPVALVLRKFRRTIGVTPLVRQYVVMSTFLAGRALGLVWRFPRVER